MGIFMITINQISSHTTTGFYPHSLGSTGHRGLQLSTHQLSAFGVVLRHLDAREGLLDVDSARGGQTHR